MTKREFYFKSTNNKSSIHVTMWKPSKKIKAILQISHGMTEHLAKYDDFATHMANNGILVIGNDHLGHGYSTKELNELGYFDAKNPSKTLVNDLHRLTKIVKKYFPDVPYFLLGHSMGSFIARRYIMTYGNEINGAIIMGTGNQPRLLVNIGIFLVTIGELIFSPHKRANFIDLITFNQYTKNIQNNESWLTKDNVYREKFKDDPFCHFTFTLNGFETLFKTISYIEKPKNINKIPKNLPLLIISGTDDPVGNYGKDVTKVYNIYKKSGIKNLKLKLYENDRHEILNELDKDSVYKDILNWIENLI